MLPSPLPPVLIVDDDPLFRSLTSLLLESHGLTVSVAAGCREALERLALARPGLVIVDMVMPELDGISTIRELRSAAEADGSAGLRFVACSGHDADEFRADLARVGVTEFIAKPFTIEELLLTLERAMGSPPASLAPRAAP